jgi:hypothetical protein
MQNKNQGDTRYQCNLLSNLIDSMQIPGNQISFPCTSFSRQSDLHPPSPREYVPSPIGAAPHASPKTAMTPPEQPVFYARCDRMPHCRGHLDRQEGGGGFATQSGHVSTCENPNTGRPPPGMGERHSRPKTGTRRGRATHPPTHPRPTQTQSDRAKCIQRKGS